MVFRMFQIIKFLNFATSYNFQHVTSSPRYAQSNRTEAEQAVQTVKTKSEKSPDPQLTLLVYGTTPLQHRYNSAQLLMSNNLHTTVPTLPCQLKPSLVDSNQCYNKDTKLKSQQQIN